MQTFIQGCRDYANAASRLLCLSVAQGLRIKINHGERHKSDKLLPSHFSRCFREAYNGDPSEMRSRICDLTRP